MPFELGFESRWMVVMFRARLAALLVALLGLAPVVAQAHGRYFCRMLERVVDECCCAVEPSSAALDSAPEVKSPDCCLRLTQGTLPSADPTRNSVAPVAALPVVLASRAPIVPPLYPEILGAAPEEDDVSPARGPPLFLKHCALLI